MCIRDSSNLGEALNILLARIEGLMRDIRHVAVNIAHDLRTPLTRLRHHLEDLKSQNPNTQQIEPLLAEVDGLLDTFSALLRITNIEKGKRHQQFTQVDMKALLQDVVELYEPLAEEKEITLVTHYEAETTLQLSLIHI